MAGALTQSMRRHSYINLFSYNFFLLHLHHFSQFLLLMYLLLGICVAFTYKLLPFSTLALVSYRLISGRASGKISRLDQTISTLRLSRSELSNWECVKSKHICLRYRYIWLLPSGNTLLFNLLSTYRITLLKINILFCETRSMTLVKCSKDGVGYVNCMPCGSLRMWLKAKYKLEWSTDLCHIHIRVV